MKRFAYIGFGLFMLPASSVWAGGLGACASFTTCTADLASDSTAITTYDITQITGGYHLVTELAAGLNTFRDDDSRTSNAQALAEEGVLCVNCATSIPFFSTAIARSKTDFGANHASGLTSIGASGTDDQGGGATAHAEVRTIALAQSAWRDVWTFNTAGHFSATIALDGKSAAFSDNPIFDASFHFSQPTTLGDWFYELRVWDVTNFSVSEEFELGGPTSVARVRDSAAFGNEQRGAFSSTLALDFDFASGVQYLVTAELRVDSRNGRDINLFNTASLTDIALSNGANLRALSGHDYLAPVSTNVPEPLPSALFATGLACLALQRWRLRSADLVAPERQAAR